VCCCVGILLWLFGVNLCMCALGYLVFTVYLCEFNVRGMSVFLCDGKSKDSLSVAVRMCGICAFHLLCIF